MGLRRLGVGPPPAAWLILVLLPAAVVARGAARADARLVSPTDPRFRLASEEREATVLTLREAARLSRVHDQYKGAATMMQRVEQDRRDAAAGLEAAAFARQEAEQRLSLEQQALRDLEAELSDPATVASSLTRQEVAAAITTQRRALEAASLQVSRLRAAERDADIRFRAAERLAQRQQQVVSAHQAAVQHAERSQAAVRPPGAAAGTTTTAATPAKPTSAGSRRTPRAAEVAAAAVSGTDADRAAHGSAASGPIPPFATHDEATWRRLGLVMFEEQQRRANAQAEKEGRPATGFLPRHIISWVYLCVNPDQQALTAEETAAIEQQVVEFREQQGLQEDDEPTLFKGFLTRGRALKFVTALSEDLARARQGGAAKDEL